MTALLEVRDLGVTYRGVNTVTRAVNDVSFGIGSGEVVGLVGESGCGKSTVALAVLGLTRHGGEITGGTVQFEDQPLLGLSEGRWRAIRGDQIGLVTQNPRGALNPVLPVGEQIQAIYRAHRKVGEGEARERALEMLRSVGINDPERRLRAFPHELSGGMAQRVLIAMALVCTPKLLLADEPTSGLDVTVQAELLDDLRTAAAHAGSSMLLVSQDLGIIANYCDRVYLMHAGEILEDADTNTFFSKPASPATAALLGAQRSVAPPELRLQGFPVDSRQLPNGCWLHPRCPFAREEDGCMTEHPALREIAPGHHVRCHRARDVAEIAAKHLTSNARPEAELAPSNATSTEEGSA